MKQPPNHHKALTSIIICLFMLLASGNKSSAQLNAWFSYDTYNGSTIPCVNTNIFFSDYSNGSVVTRNWIFEGGNPAISDLEWLSVTFSTAGNHNVTLIVGDGFGNYDTSTQILSVGEILATETHSSPTCGNSNGAIDLTVTVSLGGLGLSTHWEFDGSTNEDLSGIPAGIYYVYISDWECSLNYNILLQNSDGPQPSATHTNIGCSTAFATIDLSVSGGIPPYDFLWSNGATSEDINNLLEGNYSATVTDQTGCPGYMLVFITDSIADYFPGISATQPNCINNGSLTSNPYGGIPPYSYLWSTGETTQTITGLAAGIYTLSLTDNSGCADISVTNFTLNSACANIMEGTLFNDTNGNCAFDTGETPISNTSVKASYGAQNYYGYTDINGNYSISVGIPGTFQLSVPASTNCIATVCGINSITFSAVGDTSVQDIALLNNTGFDLRMGLTWSGANPGFEKVYCIRPYNASSIPFAGNATVTFSYDPNLVYDTSDLPLPVHDEINHTLSWNVNNVPTGYWNVSTQLRPYFHVPVSLPLTYLLQSDYDIAPSSGDCDAPNNHRHFSEEVTGSHDPNAKSVIPGGPITASDSVLTYTIDFQNSGNDTTHFVIVVDTLPPFLDPTTVENIASSTFYNEFTISGTGVLKWVFNPLFLPDSASNEPESKGFVMFKIKVKPNLPFGTTINNKASIYFDYNPAVITNYATSSIVNGVEELTVNSEQLNVFPNPANEQLTISSIKHSMNTIVITDVLGREIYSQQANAQSSTINCQLFSSGVYFVKVQLGNGNVEVKRFVKE